MSRLSPEEERELIAEFEALRDDPDAPLTLIPVEPAKNPRAFLRVELPPKTISHLHKLSEATGLSYGEVITRALDAFERAGEAPAREAPASPPARRRKKSAKVG